MNRSLMLVLALWVAATIVVIGRQNGSARDSLQSVLSSVGFSAVDNRVLHLHLMEGAEQDFQSSPPYVTRDACSFFEDSRI